MKPTIINVKPPEPNTKPFAVLVQIDSNKEKILKRESYSVKVKSSKKECCTIS